MTQSTFTQTTLKHKLTPEQHMRLMRGKIEVGSYLTRPKAVFEKMGKSIERAFIRADNHTQKAKQQENDLQRLSIEYHQTLNYRPQPLRDYLVYMRLEQHMHELITDLKEATRDWQALTRKYLEKEGLESSDMIPTLDANFYEQIKELVEEATFEKEIAQEQLTLNKTATDAYKQAYIARVGKSVPLDDAPFCEIIRTNIDGEIDAYNKAMILLDFEALKEKEILYRTKHDLYHTVRTHIRQHKYLAV